MVYLLKMLIFHGYVSHNQMVKHPGESQFPSGGNHVKPAISARQALCAFGAANVQQLRGWLVGTGTMEFYDFPY